MERDVIVVWAIVWTVFALVVAFIVWAWFLPLWRGAQVTESKPAWVIFQTAIAGGVAAWAGTLPGSKPGDGLSRGGFSECARRF